MITLGVDLASQPKNTGVCQVRWSRGAAEIELLRAGVEDDEIVELARASDVIGIDAPFGWPRAFAAFVAGNQSGPRRASDPEALRLRETDRWCWRNVTRRLPLSVSTDRIALPAFRCAGLLERIGVEDRLTGPAFEVYAAAERLTRTLIG